MFYQTDDAYWKSEAGVTLPKPEKSETFVERMERGGFGKGYSRLDEARMHLRAGTVVCAADNGRFYTVARWAARRYYRFVEAK